MVVASKLMLMLAWAGLVGAILKQKYIIYHNLLLMNQCSITVNAKDPI